MKELQALIAPQTLKGVIVRGHAGLVINELSRHQSPLPQGTVTQERLFTANTTSVTQSQNRKFQNVQNVTLRVLVLYHHPVKFEGFVFPEFWGISDQIFSTKGPEVDCVTQVDVL